MATVYFQERLTVKPGATGALWYNRDGDETSSACEGVVGVVSDKRSVADTVSYTLVGTATTVTKFVIVSDKAISVGWSGDDGADSGTTVLVPGVPFVIHRAVTTVYNTNATDRAATAESGVTDVQIYNGSGATATVEALLLVEAL